MAIKKQESKKPTAAVAVQQIDPGLFSAEDTTGYYEGMDSGAYAKPFLTILQGLSPAVQRGKPEYIEGAQPGMILNTVTKELSERVKVTVLKRSHTITYWIPREQGGGLIREEAAHMDNLAALSVIPLDDKRRRVTKEQIDGKTVNVEVIECRNFFLYVFPDDPASDPTEGQLAIASMSKSQLSVAREWNSIIDKESFRLRDAAGNIVRGLPPILHSGVWELGSVLKTKGDNSWFKWSWKFLGLNNTPAVVSVVKEKVLIAKSQTTIDRQLERMAEPQEGAAPGEM